VVEDVVIKYFMFAISSPDEFLVDTATDTVTNFVNIKLGGNILQDAMLPSWFYLVHTVDRFDSHG